MQRKERLAVGEVYHIYNKSIAKYKIFHNKKDYIRMRDIIAYYGIKNMVLSFSKYIQSAEIKQNGFITKIILDSLGKKKIAQIIAYCIMPTHIHLILKELIDGGISKFMGNILNSYAKYFNKKHKRKGPLWEGRFQNILIKTDEQLLHLTRYIHLNPVTAGLVTKPEEWEPSSYNEYLLNVNNDEMICDYSGILDIEPRSYAKFVENRISYQEELAKIKKLLLENDDTT